MITLSLLLVLLQITCEALSSQLVSRNGRLMNKYRHRIPRQQQRLQPRGTNESHEARPDVTQPKKRVPRRRDPRTERNAPQKTRVSYSDGPINQIYIKVHGPISPDLATQLSSLKLSSSRSSGSSVLSSSHSAIRKPSDKKKTRSQRRREERKEKKKDRSYY